MNSNDIIYKDVVGFEGLYKVSNMGEVYSYDRWIVDSVGHKYFLKGKHLKKQAAYLFDRCFKNHHQYKSYGLHSSYATVPFLI